MELLIFLSIFFGVVFIIFFYVWQKSGENQPPGPPKLPFIGNLHQLAVSLPHRRITNLAKTYGPLMQLQLGQIPTLVVSSPELAKKCFKEFDINFSGRCRKSVTDIVLYNSQDIAFAPYGEYWRQVRKIAVLHLFSAKRVQTYRFVREEEVSSCIALIGSKLESQINVSELVFSLMNSIVARTVVGRKNKNQDQIVPIIHRFLRSIAGFGVVDMFPSLWFIHIITGMKSRLLKFQREVDAMFEDIIKEHKDKLKGETRNLLDVLLELQRDPDSPLTTESIKAIILESLAGGIDTSAIVLEWAMSELMKNPSTMRKAQEEVRKVFVKYGKLDETILQELIFLKAVIKEVLRLHPPAPLIPKQCRQECKINGYDINAKTDAILNIWAIGRDPNYWIEPDKFYPERFLESEVDYKGFHFEFIPFGVGRRICPGMLLGLANIELPLASLLCYFDWELPDEMKPQDLDMTEKFSVVIRRKNDLYLIPTACE